MAAEIFIMDADTIEDYSFSAHSEKSLVISIHSHGMSSAFIKRTKLNGIIDTLVLEFNDTLSNDEAAGGITESDASKIYSFLYKNKDSFVDRIIFQCEDGTSRSVGCAAAIEQQIFGTISILSNPEYTVNTLCYNTVRERFEDTHSIFINYTETKEQAIERELANKSNFTSSTENTSGFPCYEDIIADISRGIQNKEFKAGTEMPSVDILAKAMNKSRYAVGKAYDILVDEGLLKKISNGTYIVAANAAVQFNDTVYKEIEGHLDNAVNLAIESNIGLDKLLSMLMTSYNSTEIHKETVE